MINTQITGKVNSIQSLGTLDGPGVRFVVFLQGCNLRCGCCHNPDTWEMLGGTEYTPEQILNKAIQFKEYFGKTGGITFSGGEPLLQAQFVKEVFSLCKKNGINTCLDTSGSIMNTDVKALLSVTDMVLLDIKYTSDELYHKHVGCSINAPLTFLSYLNENNIPVILRQVIIPTLNDNKESILRLKEIAQNNSCVIKTELLPFKKICQTKYDTLKIKFPFADIPQPDKALINSLEELINN